MSEQQDSDIAEIKDTLKEHSGDIVEIKDTLKRNSGKIDRQGELLGEVIILMNEGFDRVIRHVDVRLEHEQDRNQLLVEGIGENSDRIDRLEPRVENLEKKVG